MPRAQIFIDSYGLTWLVLCYAFSFIEIALSSFRKVYTQTHLCKSIVASIKEFFQQNELPKIIAKREVSYSSLDLPKIFLNYSLLDILIKVTETCFNFYFAITVISLIKDLNGDFCSLQCWLKMPWCVFGGVHL